MADIWRVDTKYKISLQKPSRSFLQREASAIKGFKSAAWWRRQRGKKGKEAREIMEQFSHKMQSSLVNKPCFIYCKSNAQETKE